MPVASATPAMPSRTRGRVDAAMVNATADRIEARVERLAPGFRDRIRARSVLAPDALESLDANLHGAAIAGGTAQIHQQLVFRPTPGLGRPETPVRSLYLASASAHPGGGVHGAPGAIAAGAALRSQGVPRPLGRAAGAAVGGRRAPLATKTSSIGKMFPERLR